MELRFDEQVIVVVGAASGIGAAIAKEFEQSGGIVWWLDQQASVINVAQQARRSTFAGGGSSLGRSQAFARTIDATDSQAVRQVASEVFLTHGRCDHVVVTVGRVSGQLGFPFWKVDPSLWENSLRVNLVAHVHVANAFAPAMAEAKRGTFCFLSSVAGQIGSPTDPPYSAAKAGLINFAQCAAQDLAPYGVRVNVVSPGMIQTPLNRQVWEMWRNASPDHTLDYQAWGQEKVRRVAPLGRWQQPEDVAAMVAFLASDRASNITGQTLNVDGGQRMHS